MENRTGAFGSAAAAGEGGSLGEHLRTTKAKVLFRFSPTVR